ncbi:hypothetical protein Tco_1406023 [Tanacetum coccineum]
MSSPKFAETHNVVVFLEKPKESDGFVEIIDFLKASSVSYALTVNPVIYTSCIEQFWETAKVQIVNGVRQLQALVDKKRVIVTESSIRRDLHLDDVEGTDCLPTATIFEELARMGYEKPSQKLTFYKAFFSPQWKYYIHTVTQCLSAKSTAWNEFSSSMASLIICLTTNQKFNLSKYIFDAMVKHLDGGVKFLLYPQVIEVENTQNNAIGKADPCSNSGSNEIVGDEGSNSTLDPGLCSKRLQKLVSRLAILGVVTPLEDLNKVKRSAGANNDDKNLAFLTTSGASSTNNINTVNLEVSTGTTKVNTASTEISTASFSDATKGKHHDIDNGNWNQGSSSKACKEMKMLLKGKCAIDGAGFDWTLKKQYDDLLVKLDDTGFKASTYKRGLSVLEGQILKYKEHEVLFFEEIALLKRSVEHKEYQMGLLRIELEKVKEEKEVFEFKIAKFEKSAKDLDQLLASQITDKSKKGFGYNVVPSPHPLILNRPTPLDLSYSGLEEFKEPKVNEYVPKGINLKPTTSCDKESDNSKENTDDSLKQQQKTNSKTSSVKPPLKVDKDWKEKFFSPANHVREEEPKKARENNDAPIIENWGNDDYEVEPIPKVLKENYIPTATKKEFVKPEKPVRRSVRKAMRMVKIGYSMILLPCDEHSILSPEASLRRHLKLDDQDGITSIPNSEIFEQLALMGYHTNSDKLTFQKGAFSPQWRFLIHNILHCLSPKKTAWEPFSSNIAIGRKLSDAEVQEKASTETEPFIQEVTPTEVIQDQRSSEKGSAEVSTAGATKGTASEVPVVSTVEENISTAGRTVTYSRRSKEKRTRKDKEKAIMTESEPKKKSKKELEQERLSFAEAIRLEEQMNEEQRAQIARDEEIARHWDEEERKRAMSEANSTKKIDWNDPSVIRPIFEKVWDFNQHIEPMKHGTEKMKSPKKMKSPEKIEEEDVDTQEEMKEVVKESGAKRNKSLPRKRNIVKSQKLEEDAEKEELKDFDRQDVEELYRLVKEMYSASRPEGYDLMLWGDLHTLFEPDEEDKIWKNQHEYNVISWSLYDFCDVKSKCALIASPEEMSHAWFKDSVEFIKGLDAQDGTFLQDDQCREKSMKQHNGMCGDTEDGTFVHRVVGKICPKMNRMSVDDGDGVLDSQSDDGDGVLDSQTKDVIEEASMLPTMSSNSPQAGNAVVNSYVDDYISMFNDEEQPAKSSLNDLEKTTRYQETVWVKVEEQPSLGRGLGTLKFKKKNCERALRPNYVLRSAKIRKKKMAMSLKSTPVPTKRKTRLNKTEDIVLPYDLEVGLVEVEGVGGDE